MSKKNMNQKSVSNKSKKKPDLGNIPDKGFYGDLKKRMNALSDKLADTSVMDRFAVKHAEVRLQKMKAICFALIIPLAAEKNDNAALVLDTLYQELDDLQLVISELPGGSSSKCPSDYWSDMTHPLRA